MDDGGQRENGRHKSDHYKIHTQWMIPQHQMKDNQAIKLMAVMAERDNAIHERDMALSEKKAALAERDMAILQRDAAIAERNTAIMERDNAIASLEYARENSMNGSSVPGCPLGCTATRGATKPIHHHHSHQQQQHLHAHARPTPPQLANDPYNHSREMHVTEAYPISSASEGVAKVRKVKRPRKDTKAQQFQAQATAPPKKTKSRKSKRSCGGEDLNKQANFVRPLNDWRGEMGGAGGNLNRQGTKHHNEWKDQDLGLNQVTFDESTMPVPVCSCTGKYQPCYKWGNGGWQSACCTTTLSMYPLPVMPNKRHARVGGRKMSGTVFTRILSRLAAEGHDLSVPVDLKDHWAKHGTNRYITIK